MKATEFAYWLQGYFEINGSGSLSQQQAQKVLEKANKVVNSGNEPEAYAFVSFTQGLLMGSNASQAAPVLQQKLNDVFIHSIDQSYAGDQTHFNDVHQGDGPWNNYGNPGGPVMRC